MDFKQNNFFLKSQIKWIKLKISERIKINLHYLKYNLKLTFVSLKKDFETNKWQKIGTIRFKSWC